MSRGVVGISSALPKVSALAPDVGSLFFKLDSAFVVAALLAVVGNTALHSEAVVALALIAILSIEILSPFFRLQRSWRAVRLRYEIGELTRFWLTASSVIAIAVLVVSVAWSPVMFDPRMLMLWFLLSFAYLAGFRIVLRLGLRINRARGADHKVVAFVGGTGTAQALGQIFKTHGWMGLDVLGVFDDRASGERRDEDMPRSAIAGTVEHLVDLARMGQVDSIYITLPLAAEARVRQIIDRFSDTTASIYYCPSFFRFEMLRGRFDNVFGQPVVSIIESPLSGSSALFKRLEDILFVLMLAPLVLPVLALAAIAIRLESPGPIFFRQMRYGLDGRAFRIFKLRSMYVTPPGTGFVQATRNDPRVTRVGAFLRKTSIDELPQLINVLLGQMSVVGPRPHPVQLDEEFRTKIYRYMVRHKMKPGITGLAQVNGARGETDTLEKMERRVEFDLAYLSNWSLILDVKILLRSLLIPFRSANAY